MNKKYLLITFAIVSAGLLYKRSVQSMAPMQTQPMPELTIMQYVQQHGFQIDEKGRWDLMSKGITSLEGLDQLNQLDFDPRVVKELVLSLNDIQEIPRGIFAQFYNLQRLNLDHNRISIVYGITSNQDVQSLHMLARLRELGEASIQPGSFAGLASLIYLSLGNNKLTSIPAGLLTGLTSLETLSLYDNKLVSLPERVFAGLTRLEGLYLHDNQLKSLSEGLFARLIHLKDLRLDSNELTLIPEGLLAQLVSLKDLDLSRNELASLPEGVFTGLTSLKKLFLQGNPLTMTARQIKQQCFSARSRVYIYVIDSE